MRSSSRINERNTQQLRTSIDVRKRDLDLDRKVGLETSTNLEGDKNSLRDLSMERVQVASLRSRNFFSSVP